MGLSILSLLAIFVWMPLMAYVGWKWLQTFQTKKRARGMRRGMRRASDGERGRATIGGGLLQQLPHSS